MALCKARRVGTSLVESPDYTGAAIILELEIPAAKVSDLNKNDTLRREVAAILASAALQEPQMPATPVEGLLGQ